jgi:probable F420-dependent oxidoreductase
VTGKLREQIEVIRAFWDCWQNGTKLNYRGEYYKVTLMSPFFNPGPLPNPLPPGGQTLGPIPIYIAGVNTGLAKLAGELCEGFHAHPFHSVRYINEVILPAIAEGARKANRKREAVAISITAFIATTPEDMNFARAQISFYASTPSYRPVMDLHGWSSVAEKLSAHASKGEWMEMPMLITDEMLHEFAVVTEEDKLADELKKRYDGIAARLTLYTPFVPGERDEWWSRLAKEFN